MALSAFSFRSKRPRELSTFILCSLSCSLALKARLGFSDCWPLKPHSLAGATHNGGRLSSPPSSCRSDKRLRGSKKDSINAETQEDDENRRLSFCPSPTEVLLRSFRVMTKLRFRYLMGRLHRLFFSVATEMVSSSFRPLMNSVFFLNDNAKAP